jgi:hypothetical protein
VVLFQELHLFPTVSRTPFIAILGNNFGPFYSIPLGHIQFRAVGQILFQQYCSNNIVPVLSSTGVAENFLASRVHPHVLTFKQQFIHATVVGYDAEIVSRSLPPISAANIKLRSNFTTQNCLKSLDHC